MDIAKKLGFGKKFPDAPRAPVRNAMEALHKLHFVTSKKTGIKYNYSITNKGIEALKAKPVVNVEDKEAGSTIKPASNPKPSERPANTDIQCPKCAVWNPFHAEYCKQCGVPMKAAPVVVSAQLHTSFFLSFNRVICRTLSGFNWVFLV